MITSGGTIVGALDLRNAGNTVTRRESAGSSVLRIESGTSLICFPVLAVIGGLRLAFSATLTILFAEHDAA